MGKLSAFFLTALLLLVLGAPSASTAMTPTPGTPAPYFGFNDNAVSFQQTNATTDAALAAQVGSNVSRLTFDWRYSETSPGNWNLRMYDSIYQADLAQGIRPIFILTFAPKWAWADPNQCTTTMDACRFPPGPTHIDAWRNVVQMLVQRYPQMAALEIWNEPNLTSFWNGGPDPAYYTRLLGEAYDAAKATGSAIPILGGSLSNGIEPDSASAMNPRNFLKAMYANGAKGKMDGLSIHTYPEDIDLWRVFKMLTDTRDIRDANGDSVPLWITELGITTTGNSGGNYTFNENDQAFTLRKLYDELMAMNDVRAVIFHTLIEPSIFPSTSTEVAFGLLRLDLTPKPAYCSLAAARGTSYVCPSGVASVTDLPTQRLRWAAQDYAQAAADAARAWYRSHGTYAGLTPAGLHAIDPTLSATGADGLLAPGASADPSRVGVWVWGTAGAENLLLCNTSQADRSYCIETQPGNQWVYGSSTTNVNGTAGAITNGKVSWW
jgi:hypothetical protein